MKLWLSLVTSQSKVLLHLRSTNPSHTFDMSILNRSRVGARLLSCTGARTSVAKFAPIMSVAEASLPTSRFQYRTFTSTNIVSSEPDFVCTTDINKPPSEKIDRLADEVLALNFLEMNQLMRYLQSRLNLPEEFYTSGGLRGGGGGGAAKAGGGAAAAAAEPVKAKEAFDIKLVEVPAASKIKIIKEVRAITGLGLKEAKDMVEGAPIVVKQGLKKDEAEKLLKTLIDAGAKGELL